MQIENYFETTEKEYWRKEIEKGDWRAAKYLSEIIDTEKFAQAYGKNAQVLLLVEGKKLIAFCTYAEHDEIPDPDLKPWSGFVYTFPEFRGARRMGKLLEHVYLLAKKDGYPFLYISTEEEGLYEKYGFTYWISMENEWGDLSRIYRMKIEEKDYSEVLGRKIEGTIDRPLGSAHPDHPDMIYPVNYGYVDGVFAQDGEEQDVYLLGTDQPLEKFSASVIGVVHRLNDCEDKWIATPDGKTMDRESVLHAISFQEQYYMGELYLQKST